MAGLRNTVDLGSATWISALRGPDLAAAGCRSFLHSGGRWPAIVAAPEAKYLIRLELPMAGTPIA